MHPRILLVLLAFVAPAAAQGGITSLAPSSVNAGASAFTLTVNGGGFAAGNIVQWDGNNLPTTFVGAHQLTASVSAALLTNGGAHNIRVKLSVFVSSFSNTVVFDVNHPVPTLSSVNPNPVFGGSAFTLTATGTNFAPASVVRWNGSVLPTAFVSTTQVTASVAAVLVAAAGPVSVTVANPAPGGGVSAAVTLTVSANPVPVITGILPSFTPVGSGPITVSFGGSGFTPSSIVRLGGVGLVTTFISSTHLEGLLPVSMTGTAASLVEEVVNPPPGGGTATFGVFQVTNPVPVLGTISPTVVTAGGLGFPLTVTGSSFNASTTIRFDGTPLATTLVDPTHVATTITASMIASAAFHTILVTNPPPGGGTGLSANLFVVNPAPAIALLSQTSIAGGASDQALTIIGTGFLGVTVVDASGTGLQVVSQSANQLVAVLPGSLLHATAALAIRVTNPAPGGGSGASPLLVTGPVIFATNPTIVPVLGVGSPPVPLVVNGGSFQSGDTIRINGVVRPTTFVNGGTLSCGIDASIPQTLQPGGFAVTVTRQGTPGFVVSNAVGVKVGTAGFPDNAGTVTLGPVPPGPGSTFDIRVELSTALVPITVIADVASPSPFLVAPAPGFDIVIGPGVGSPLVFNDTLGLFGAPFGGIVASDDLSPFGFPGSRGLFRTAAITLPPVPLGVTFSLAAVYGDQASPIGVNVTYVSGPFSI